MLIQQRPKIGFSEVTPKAAYLDRRTLMTGARGAGGRRACASRRGGGQA